MINVVATIFLTTTTSLFHFHIGNNIAIKCTTYCRFKPKDVKVDGKYKEVKEMRSSELVDNIMKA